MARRFTIAIAVVATVTLSAFGTMPTGRAQPATDSGGRIVAAAERLPGHARPRSARQGPPRPECQDQNGLVEPAHGHRDAGRRHGA